jgi:hypothetical protein
MKTIFDLITVNYAEYSYFQKSNTADQVKFLFELYDGATRRVAPLDLSGFFQEINMDLDDQEITISGDMNDPNRVDVLIDDDNIMIESNSLRAIRHITLKFVESGYILARDKDMEKTFRKDKITKYMRIFRIIDQVSTICPN